jgi:hypothetical protein
LRRNKDNLRLVRYTHRSRFKHGIDQRRTPETYSRAIEADTGETGIA